MVDRVAVLITRAIGLAVVAVEDEEILVVADRAASKTVANPPLPKTPTISNETICPSHSPVIILRGNV